MSLKGFRKQRLCKCGESNPENFPKRSAGICCQCVYARRAPKSRQYTEKSRTTIKTEVLSHYGPEGKLQCSWSDCCVVDIDMLVLDHVNDNGAEERRGANSNGRGHELYRKLRNENYPVGYQTLCCNHNHKKELLRIKK